MRALAILTLSALALACSPGSGGSDGGGGSGPRLATYPARVDFGVDAGTPVDIGSIGTQTLTIKNIGSGTLELSSVTYQGDPELTATRPASMSLGPDAGTDVTITFSPMDARAYSGRIVINSNARNISTGTAAISVTGLGKQP